MDNKYLEKIAVSWQGAKNVAKDLSGVTGSQIRRLERGAKADRAKYTELRNQASRTKNLGAQSRLQGESGDAFLSSKRKEKDASNLRMRRETYRGAALGAGLGTASVAWTGTAGYGMYKKRQMSDQN